MGPLALRVAHSLRSRPSRNRTIPVTKVASENASSTMSTASAASPPACSTGADTVLRKRERELFMNQEWPAMIIRMHSLGIDPAQLLANLQRNEESGP